MPKPAAGFPRLPAVLPVRVEPVARPAGRAAPDLNGRASSSGARNTRPASARLGAGQPRRRSPLLRPVAPPPRLPRTVAHRRPHAVEHGTTPDRNSQHARPDRLGGLGAATTPPPPTSSARSTAAAAWCQASAPDVNTRGSATLKSRRRSATQNASRNTSGRRNARVGVSRSNDRRPRRRRPLREQPPTHAPFPRVGNYQFNPQWASSSTNSGSAETEDSANRGTGGAPKLIRRGRTTATSRRADRERIRRRERRRARPGRSARRRGKASARELAPDAGTRGAATSRMGRGRAASPSS